MFVNPAYAFVPSLRLILKVDEMWSFVGKKKVQQWLWWVEDSYNGQIVAFTFGRRTNATFRRLKKCLSMLAFLSRFGSPTDGLRIRIVWTMKNE